MFELSPMLAFVFMLPPRRRPRRLPRGRGAGVSVIAGVADSSPAAGGAGGAAIVPRRRPRRPRRPPPLPPPPPGLNEHILVSPGTGESVRRSPAFRARTETLVGVPPDASSKRSVAPV